MADTTAVKPDATQDEINEVLESDNPQVFSQAVRCLGFRRRRTDNPSFSTRTVTVLRVVLTAKSKKDMPTFKRSKRR